MSLLSKLSELLFGTTKVPANTAHPLDGPTRVHAVETTITSAPEPLVVLGPETKPAESAPAKKTRKPRAAKPAAEKKPATKRTKK